MGGGANIHAAPANGGAQEVAAVESRNGAIEGHSEGVGGGDVDVVDVVLMLALALILISAIRDLRADYHVVLYKPYPRMTRARDLPFPSRPFWAPFQIDNLSRYTGGSSSGGDRYVSHRYRLFSSYYRQYLL